MSTKNTKTGKKAKVKMKADIGTLSGGLSECESMTETERITGYKVGNKSIPALFWKKMSSTNGKKVTKAKKENGND